MKPEISDNAMKLANDLSNQGIYLEPKSGSIFEPLITELCEIGSVEPSYSVEEFKRKVNETLIDSRPNIFAAFEENDPDAEQTIEGNTFDIVCDDTRKQLTAVIDRVMGTMRDEVLPSIVKVANATMGDIAELLDGNNIRIQIKDDKSNMAIWSNPSFQQLLIWGDKEIKGNSSTVSATFPDIAIEVLAERIKTGEDLLDAEIDEYLNEFDRVTLIEHTFHECFARNEEKVYPGQTKLGESIVAFLLAMSFHEDCPDGVGGVELDAFRKEMMAIAKYHSAVLLETMSHYLYNCNRDRLVVANVNPGMFYESDCTIVVNARLINRFYDMGGTVDGLLGNSLNNMQGDFHQLLENNFKNERAWANFIRMESTRHDNDFQRHFLNSLRKHLYAFSEENKYKLTENDIEYLFDKSHYITKENAFDFISARMNEFFFKNDEYGYILRCLNATTAKFPEMNPDEALVFVMVDWLADWALSQINVR